MSGSSNAHAKYSASGSYRWLNCPGSIALSKDAPPQPSSPYALEGTCAHEVLERILSPKFKRNPKPGDYFVGVEVTEEMLGHVEAAAEYIRERVEEMPTASLLIEQKVSLESVRKGMFGTCDIILAEPFGKLLIADYKHGQGKVVEVVENSQLIYYALAAFDKFNAQFMFEEIEICVMQPRAAHEDGPFRSYSFKPEHLETWRDKFKDGIKACESENPELVVGEHCQFCPAASICLALQDHTMETAKAVLFEGKVTVPDAGLLDVNDIPKVLEAADLIEQWVREVRLRAHVLAEQGQAIQGFKLVQKRSNRKWKDEKQAAEFLSLEADPDKLFTKKFVSPAQAEKIVGKKAVEELTFKPETGTTLVPESDKRKAVTAGVNVLFNNDSKQIKE